MRKGLSLCMICRDNSNTIVPALQDARRAGCTELIVVDTGSIDNTPQLAQNEGATVLFDPWIDDFAHSKNFALEHATNDWCLILDSDDRIANAGEVAALARELDQLPADAIEFQVVTGVGAHTITVSQIRMVKRSSGLKFEFPIHERINIDDHPLIRFSQAWIEHRHAADSTHAERNLRILEKARSIDGGWNKRSKRERQHIRHNLAREYWGHGRKALARQYFDQFFEAGNSKERHDYWANLAYAQTIDDPITRMERLEFTVKCNPDRAEAYVEIGRLLVSEQRFTESLTYFAKATTCKRPLQGIVHLPDYTWRPALLAAVAQFHLGNLPAATKLTAHAKQLGAPPELIRDAS